MIFFTALCTTLFFISPKADSDTADIRLIWMVSNVHEFGELEKGSAANHAFTFLNNGNTPLTIENVRTTCGCTASEWPIHPIMPGDTGQIKINYDASKKGAFEKKVRAFFNGIRKAEILTIKGIVR